MKIVQVFYDYECPHCKRGYETLLELLPLFPEAEIEWRPIESHPRPEESHPHTDLCVQSYYIARELGVDLLKFHALLYRAVVVEGRDVEKPEVLGEILDGLLDREKFMAMLESGKYAAQVTENNDLAYEKEGVWYVPAFRAGSLKLDAAAGVGVSRADMKNFLEKARAG